MVAPVSPCEGASWTYAGAGAACLAGAKYAECAISYAAVVIFFAPEMFSRVFPDNTHS